MNHNVIQLLHVQRYLHGTLQHNNALVGPKMHLLDKHGYQISTARSLPQVQATTP